MEGITFSSSGIAAIAIGRNVRNHDYGAHGAAVISLVNGKELNRYHTKGLFRQFLFLMMGNMQQELKCLR